MPLNAAELDRIARLAQQGPHEGYPAPRDRLYIDTPGLDLHGATLTVPDGPWHVADHPNRRGRGPHEIDPDVPRDGHQAAAADLQTRWRAAGLTLDQHGRPVHPDWRQLLADPRIGLPTGAGYFWRYGPNPTVDAVVERGRQILLIRRRSGQWALPGGFQDRSDASAEAAAVRELAEETGLGVPRARTRIIINRRAAGPHTTLHAWTTNTVVRVTADPRYLADTEPVAGDDAVDAAWTDLDKALTMDLFHVHAEYITQIANAAR